MIAGAPAAILDQEVTLKMEATCWDGGSKRCGSRIPCDTGAAIPALGCLYTDCLYLGVKCSILLGVCCSQT